MSSVYEITSTGDRCELAHSVMEHPVVTNSIPEANGVTEVNDPLCVQIVAAKISRRPSWVSYAPFRLAQEGACLPERK